MAIGITTLNSGKGTKNLTVPSAQAPIQYGSGATPQQFSQQVQSSVAPTLNFQGQVQTKPNLSSATPKLGQQPPQPVPEGMKTVDEFASTIKQKYPQYANIDNTELTNKILEKYPVYKDKVFMGQTEQPQEQQGGGFGGFLKSLISPELSAVASGIRGIQSIPSVAKEGYGLLTGNKELANKASARATEIQNAPLFGAKTFMSERPKELIGQAVQAAGQGILGGSPVLSGGAQVLGSDIENGKGLKQTAIDTGGALLLGGALKLASPLIGRAAGAISDAAPQAVKDVVSAGTNSVKSGLKTAGEYVNPTLKKITPDFMEQGVKENTNNLVNKITGRSLSQSSMDKAVGNISKQYEKVLPLTPTQKAKEATLLAKTGDNVYTTLAKNGVNLGSEEAPQQLQEISSQFQNATEHAQANEHGYFNLNEIKSNAFSQIDKKISSETARETAKAKISNEIEALTKANPNAVIKGVNGETKINSDLVERLRKTGNSWTPFNASDPEKVGQSAGYSLSNAVRDQVDEEGTFPAYREANKEWGKIIHAQEVLGNIEKSGKNFKIPGGLSGAISRRVLSGVLGYHTAGIGGAVLGELGSEYAARILANPELRTYFDRKLVQEFLGKNPTPEAISKLESQIRGYVDKQASLKQLPGPSTIFGQARSIPESRMEVLPAEKTVFRNPKTGQINRGYKSTSK